MLNGSLLDTIANSYGITGLVVVIAFLLVSIVAATMLLDNAPLIRLWFRARARRRAYRKRHPVKIIRGR